MTTKTKLTPMMEQYYNIKNKNKEHLVFYRMGDFYELFDDDAIVASNLLNTKLTKRNKKSETLMSGVPFHSAERHIVELLKNNYSVAICEQTNKIGDNGLVVRQVEKIYTPSDLIQFCEKNEDQFKISILNKINNDFVLATLNLNNGNFTASKFNNIESALSKLNYENPSEVITNINESISSRYQPTFFSGGDKRNLINERYLSNSNNKEMDSILSSANTLLNYIFSKNKSINFVKQLEIDNNEYLSIDNQGLKHLNLIDDNYSLFNLLNKTNSSSGARRLKESIKKPFINKELIEKRNDGIEFFNKNEKLKEQIKSKIKKLYDMERLLARVNSGNIRPEHLVELSNSIQTSMQVKDTLDNKIDVISEKHNKDILLYLAKLINNIIYTEHNNSELFINPQYNGDISELITQIDNSDDDILDYTESIRDDLLKINKKITGINIINTTSDGLVIEVPTRFDSDFKSNIDKIGLFKDDKPFIIKGIKSKTRYKTKKLQDLDIQKVVLMDKIKQKQNEIFELLLNEVSKQSIDIIKLSNEISEIDMLISLSDVANEYGFKRVSFDNHFSVKDSYHPLLLLNDGIEIVKNDICFDGGKTNILSGANMSGKSTFMRQAATLIVMAQMGSFLPVSLGKVKIYDRILSRVGADDDIENGKSTFMMEMLDIANIFRNSTKNSFIIIDEVGRGTNPNDGESLSVAITKALTEIGADIIISTHYTNVIMMKSNKINNLYIETLENEDGSVTFSHKVKDGISLNSYAFEIATLAGIPEDVINYAIKIKKGDNKWFL